MLRIAVVASACNRSDNSACGCSVLDLDVLEELGIEARDVVFVLVRRHEQVEALLASAGIGQHRLQVRDGRLQVADSANRSAVDQDVKIIDLGANLPALRNPAVEAVPHLDVVSPD
jgi:hypothetical protein